jgi:hypothetical protein
MVRFAVETVELVASRSTFFSMSLCRVIASDEAGC